jgi:hypothetical protein
MVEERQHESFWRSPPPHTLNLRMEYRALVLLCPLIVWKKIIVTKEVWQETQESSNTYKSLVTNSIALIVYMRYISI